MTWKNMGIMITIYKTGKYYAPQKSKGERISRHNYKQHFPVTGTGYLNMDICVLGAKGVEISKDFMYLLNRSFTETY